MQTMCFWGVLLTAGLTWGGGERAGAQSTEWPAQRQPNGAGPKITTGAAAAPHEDPRAADGTVTLHGAAASLEQQAALSRALHHVPGCTSVANLTAIAATGSTAPVVTQAPALPAAAPIQRTSHVEPAAAPPGGAYVTRGVVYLEENNNSAPAPAPVALP